MTRFFAHLVLYLQLIDDKDALPSPVTAQPILEAYVDLLQRTGARTLVAMYAGELGANAVERYALFLASMDLSVDKDARRAALADAHRYNLDVYLVATQAAQTTIVQAMRELDGGTHGVLPDLAQTGELGPTEAEERLRRSLEWTGFDEQMAETALENANVIIRYFLGARRFFAVLFRSPPRPLPLTRARPAIGKTKLAFDVVYEQELHLPEGEGPIKFEYRSYRELCIVWTKLNCAHDKAAEESPNMARETRETWKRDYKVRIIFLDSVFCCSPFFAVPCFLLKSCSMWLQNRRGTTRSGWVLTY
jgi:nuclear pore complex protein Nup107